MGLSFKEFLIGGGAIVLGIATDQPWLVKFGIAYTLGQVFEPEPIEAQRDGFLTQSISTTNHLPIVYGRARIAPRIVWWEYFDRIENGAPVRNVGETPNQTVHIVGCYCVGNRVPQAGEAADPGNGQIEHISTTFFDDTPIFAFDGTLFDDAPDSPLITSAFKNFRQFEHEGAHNQLADIFMVGNWQNHPDYPWTNAHQLQGIAYCVWQIEYHRKWQPSLPNISSVIAGRFVYDPRDGIWSNIPNAALCVRDYLLDARSGAALTLAQLNEDSFIAMADLADEDLTDSEGTIVGRKYECHGPVDTGQSVLQNLQDLLFTGGFVLVWEAGEFHLRKFLPDTPLHPLALDENNIIGDWTLSRGEPAERANLVIASYVQQTGLTDLQIKDQVVQVQYPTEGEENVYLVEDQGFEVPKEISLPFVANEWQARLRAEEELEFARNDLTVALSAREEALEYAIADRVALTHQTFGLMDREFWVLGVGLNFDDTTQLLLRSIAGTPSTAETPAPVESIPLEGVPFEVVESTSNGHVWVGYVAGDQGFDDVVYDVFDPLTGDRVYRVRVSEMNVPAGFGPPNWANGTGAAYHPIRDEVWLYVGADPDPPGGTDGVAAISVRNAQTFVEKAFHVYPGTETVSAVGGSRAIEYCPLTGNMYAAIRTPDPADATKPWVVAELDAASGAVLKKWKYSNAVSFPDGNGFEDIPQALLWNAHKARFVGIAGTFDQPFAFDPLDDSGETEDFTGGAVLGSLGETTFQYGEPEEWPGEDGLMFHVTTRQSDEVDHGISVPAALGAPPNWSAFATYLTSSIGGGFGPFAVEYVPSLPGMAVSLADTDLWNSTNPSDDVGMVAVYDRDGNIIRTFRTDQIPARLVYVPRFDAIAVVDDYWEFRTTRVVRFFRVGGEFQRPTPPPDQPSDPTQPPPLAEPEPDPTAPPADAPTVTAGRDYCDASGVTETSGLWSGTAVAGVEIDYTDGSDPGTGVRVSVFAPGANPDEAGPLYQGGAVVDADTVRLQTYSVTVAGVPAAEKPVCGGPERDDFDQFFDVYLQHDLGGGTFSAYSNSVTVRVVSPRPHVDDEDDVPLGVGAPTLQSADVLCTEIGLSETDGPPWTGEVQVIASLFATAAQGAGTVPLEFLEFEAGADPLSATPTRTQILRPGGGYRYNWLFWRVTVTNESNEANLPQCGGPSSTPDEARDYYARHVLGDDTYGPLSGRRSLTFKHPGPA